MTAVICAPNFSPSDFFRLFIFATDGNRWFWPERGRPWKPRGDWRARHEQRRHYLRRRPRLHLWSRTRCFFVFKMILMVGCPRTHRRSCEGIHIPHFVLTPPPPVSFPPDFYLLQGGNELIYSHVLVPEEPGDCDEFGYSVCSCCLFGDVVVVVVGRFAAVTPLSVKQSRPCLLLPYSFYFILFIICPSPRTGRCQRTRWRAGCPVSGVGQPWLGI